MNFTEEWARELWESYKELGSPPIIVPIELKQLWDKYLQEDREKNT